MDRCGPATAARGSDRPGRVSFQGRRNSVEQTDWHGEAETAFAKRAVAALDELVSSGPARDVAIAAPPRTLAVLRRSLGSDTLRKVIAELPHDLVNLPVVDIEVYLGRARVAS